LAGMGRIGSDAYTDSGVALWELAPDSRVEFDWHMPALDRHGAINIVHRAGTLPDGGGEFESEYLYLHLVSQGRVSRIEMFEMDALETALARFEELRPDPLRIPENSAIRVVERWGQAALARDADALRSVLHPSYVSEDRRRLVRTTTGRDTEIDVNLPWFHEGAWRFSNTVLATAGDLLVLQSWLFVTGDHESRSEIEWLEVDEVDDSGRLVRSVIFDREDQAAAYDELFERWAGGGAEGMPPALVEMVRGWNAHDLAAARAGLADDLVLEDHRRAGMGRVEGADNYLESVAALHELIPDARADSLYTAAVADYGSVFVSRNWGHNTEGGEVESIFTILVYYPDGKLLRMEMFDVEHLDAALARFEELGDGRLCEDGKSQRL